MRLFRILSQVLIVAALGLGTYDLVKGWFVDATFKIRNVQEFFGGLKVLQGFMPKGMHDALLRIPAPLAVALLAVFVYLIYRLLALIKGEDKSARL